MAQETIMLSKCANPECSTTFLYLHQGKLFRFEVETRARSPMAGPNGSAEKLPLHTEYFWLCESCLGRITLVQHQGSEVKAVPVLRLRAAS
jgi:hypothetical protein